MQRRIRLRCIVGQHTRIACRHYNHLRHKCNRVDLYRQTLIVILTEYHLLAVLEDNRVLRPLLTIGYPRVRTIIKDNTVHEALHDRTALMCLGCYQTIHGRRYIHIQRTGKERPSGTQYQLSGNEWTLYRTKRTRLADETLGAGRRILTFSQTIDTVIEQADVQVHIAPYLMNEMVSSDSQTVSITTHLPNRQFRMTRFQTRSNGSSTTVNGVKTVCIEIMRHTATAADTGDNSNLMRRNTYLCHRFLQSHTDSVVTATGAETYVLIGFKLRSFHSFTVLQN